MLNKPKDNVLSIKRVCHHQTFVALLSLLLQLFSINTFAQDAARDFSQNDQKNIRPAYLDLSLGVNISNFRDFATSPLIYSGNPIYISLSHIDIDKKRESNFGLSHSFGRYKSNFNSHDSESKVKTFSLNYFELFQLTRIINSKLNIKVGSQINSTFNHRENAKLFNNSEGVDIITTLFGSAKVTLNINLGRTKFKKSHTWSYIINLGFVNSSYRNGFAYTSPSAPLNTDDFFEGYKFKVFRGFRFNSTLDYTVFLKNKNALQFSYCWDVYSTGGHHDDFEMSSHVLKLSLLFGLK